MIFTVNIFKDKCFATKCYAPNTALKTLYCGNNQLTSLDVSNNRKLTSLACYSSVKRVIIPAVVDDNGEVITPEVEVVAKLLTDLDVSQNTALRKLYCYNNKLMSLNISNNSKLTRLDCYSNQLESLNVSQNTALTYLSCRSNLLTSLEVSANTNLVSAQKTVGLINFMAIKKYH